MVKAEEPSPKYAEVLSALQTGNTPKVILDLNRCTTRTAGRRAVRLEIGMRLEPFLAASQCDRHPIGHAPMTTSVGLHYLRSASDQDASSFVLTVRAHMGIPALRPFARLRVHSTPPNLVKRMPPEERLFGRR
ncbi:VirK family protein [Bradyrhizobium sp. 45]|uniref:VirK family protein n=1 Tax=Bradyrhizobium sp. 45 TaxID=1043587 RepID=UPI001FF9C184|nr:VirK family protein [Bradyrhizobium sp. 45]